MRKSTSLLIAVSLGAAVFNTAVAQEPFQWEVGVGVSQLQDEFRIDSSGGFGTFFITDSSTDTDRLALNATWFFEPVTAPNGPLERAAFLGRASSVSVAAVRSDIDLSFTRFSSTEPLFSLQDDFASNALGVSARYVLPNSDWFIEGRVAREDFESLSGNSTDQYSAAVGRYLGDNTAVSLRIERSEFGTDSILPGTSRGLDNYAVAVTHIGDAWGDWQYAVDSSLTESDQDSVDLRFDVAATLYPTSHLGVGLSASVSAEDFSEQSKRYGVFGRWFVTDAWSVSTRYEWTDFDDSPASVDRDDNAFELRVDYRF